MSADIPLFLAFCARLTSLLGAKWVYITTTQTSDDGYATSLTLTLTAKNTA